MAGIIIGVVAGIACAYAVGLKAKFGYDDALDVVGVHAVGGIIGALLIGIFADTAINSAGANGLLFGGGLTLLGHQIVGVAAAAGFAFVASWILLKLIDKTIGLRVSADDEALGLDKGLHAEDGYVFTEPEYVVVAPAKPKKKR